MRNGDFRRPVRGFWLALQTHPRSRRASQGSHSARGADGMAACPGGRAMMTRRGTSLVELMVVIVLLGIVSSLTVQLLLTMFHADAWQQEESAADYALG